jgi:hypothetical protein
MLTAELTTMISAQPLVLVSVRDTGPGFPPEIQTQLFQKFVTGLLTSCAGILCPRRVSRPTDYGVKLALTV